MKDIEKSKLALIELYDRALNGSKETMSLIKWNDTIKKALTRLEELEKKETPMKPKMVDYTTQHFLCPSCNETISVDESETFNKIFNVFCKYCGQRLELSDGK